jgi:hypothetical protein
MFTRIRRWFNQFFRKSRTVNREPLNAVSLIVIIVIDIFILINVFIGLADISQWHLSPAQAESCYAEWQAYRTQQESSQSAKDFNYVERALVDRANSQRPWPASFAELQKGHWGTVSADCLNYAQAKEQLNTANNQRTRETITEKESKVSRLDQSNRTIRAQYDSTLLEKMANQPRNQSINVVGAEKAKQTLDQNNREIATLKREIADLTQQLLAQPEVASWLALLNNGEQFRAVESRYQQASFWYPSIQMGLQALFLLPLIAIALAVHTFALRRHYGLVALISWHLLVIFLIPLLLKIFEFLQVGVLLTWLTELISVLFSGLLFLVSYLYILLIPLVGFGIIKVCQNLVLKPKAQAAKRLQRSCCLQCAKKIQPQDAYCPHCGYAQFAECPNCHGLTYQHLPYCKHCGNANTVAATNPHP